MANGQVVTLERSGSVATVWLDRPEARNAMGPAFWTQLPGIMAEVSGDDEIRAVVVAAKGPHFSVGLDLKSMGAELTGQDTTGQDKTAQDKTATPSTAARAVSLRAGVLRMQGSVTSVADCPKPVIAAVHGYCIGGGVDVISACDIRLASADAVFSVRETRMAIVADLGSLQRLPRILAKGHLAELAYTGKDITAARAKEIGLVNEVFSDFDTLVDGAMALAQEIAANSPLVVQGTKSVLRACEDRSVAEGLDYVATWNAAFLQSDDLTEAMTSFLEKRPPEFTGN